MQKPLTIAVSKGRILNESLPLLAELGIRPLEDPEQSRSLVLSTSDPDVRLVMVRAADVPTYVEHGAAEAGIAGKDVLLEHEGDGLYEPLDLRIARCRMVLAGPAQETTQPRRLRIATKYVNTTRRHFAARGEQVEIIRLYGSMELAPLLGLADRIVDLVDSGRTLQVNGLVAIETLADISSRLILNKAAMKLTGARIAGFVKRLAAVVGA